MAFQRGDDAANRASVRELVGAAMQAEFQAVSIKVFGMIAGFLSKR